MSHYRRANTPGGSYFFTLVTYRRQAILCDEPIRNALREAIKNKVPIEVTLRNYKKNGDLFYNHLMMTPLFDSKGNLLYFLGVQYDATEQVQADEEIKRLNARLEALEK